MFETFGMNNTLLIVAFVVFVLLAAIALFGRQHETRASLERRAFLTPAELNLLTILRRHFPHHHVNCQVSMGALLKPTRGLDRKASRAARNRISQKVVDFVVIDPETGHVETIIELDDASHDARKDADRDRLLSQGHYRIVRIPSKPQPTPDNVAARLATSSVTA